MNWKFKDITIRNFLSIGNEPVHIELDKVQSTLIVGGNGQGKTTILEALTFLLYGRTYRKINQSNIINSFNGSDCVVEGNIQVGNDLVHIKRGIKPKIFETTVNGVLLETMSATDDQKRLESMIGLPFNVYKQLVVLGTIDYEEFMTLSAGDRRKFLERILKLDVISIMDEDNKGELKNINIKLDLTNGKIDTLYNQLERDKERIKRNEELIEEKIKNLEILKSKIEEVKENIKLSEKDYQEELEVFKNVGEPVKAKIPDLITMDKNEIEKFEKIYKVIESKILEFEKEKSKLNNRQVEIKQDNRTLEIVIKQYKNGGNCPSCNKKLDMEDEEPKAIQTIIDRNENEIKEIEENIEKLNNEIENLKEKKRQVDLKKSELENKIEIENKEIYEERVRIEKEYNEKALERQKLSNKVDSLLSKVNTLRSSLDSLESQYFASEGEIESLKTVMINPEDIIKDIDELKEERDVYLINISRRNMIASILKDDGIRSDMINRYIPLFNASVQKYLNLLGADYIFTVDSNFNETIHSRGRENFKYESFSRGEQSRIDLAILFSWRDIISKVNGREVTALFLDEVFDSSTDTEGVENIMNVLRSLENVNVFSISHRDHDPENFDSVIRVNKVGRFSTYERTYTLDNC